jgi:hypothetical protein
MTHAEAPFALDTARSITITATGASTTFALPPRHEENSVVITNLSTAIAYVDFGSSTKTVSATGSTRGYPILATSKEALTIPLNATHIAAISASGSVDLHIIIGRGA